MTQIRNKYSASQGLTALLATAWNIAAADGVALVAIAAFVIVLGREYGAAALGKFSFAVAVTSMAQTVTDAGFDITLPRSVSRQPADAYNLTASALRIKLFLSIFTLPIALGASLVKDLPTILTTLVFALDVVPSTLSYALIGSLRGLNLSNQAARINALYNVVPVVICLAVLPFGMPLPVFAMLILVGDVAKYFHLEKILNEHCGQPISIKHICADTSLIFNKELLLTAWHDQRGVTLTNLYSAALVRMPSVMLGWFATDAQHGVYAAASRFFSALRIVPGAALNAIIPVYAQRNEESPRIRTILGLAILVSGALGLSLYFGAPLLMKYTFNYTESIVILQVLAIAFVALFIKTCLEAFLLAAHQERRVNMVLAAVSILAVICYALAARSSALDVARIVCAAESILCLGFLVMFGRMKRSKGQHVAVPKGDEV